ncbi:universal stress protein [Rubrivirga sp. S365]|uniref:Universal stress protein n=1 Tax=Rubrivirga litoralis TaxID=3075598 RepID=A0ABU3BNJ3_9BACT|nr:MULTISPECIES: universal stress protein [unclassified Rubrivirga]MDT0630856.1 universal stress protein [Rubrivirga sp. F394]MDT7857408.1 universal stress protein [Rubrivirga sp. S365]
MLPPRPVVVAVDFSPGSEAALVRAAALAAQSGAALHLLHADAAPPSLGGAAHAGRGGPLWDRLGRFAAAALDRPAPGATFAVLRGPSVSAAILDYAGRVEAGLLVVGARGGSGADRLLVGGVAAACVAGAACPVLVVPQAAHVGEPSPVVPVLVAVDFTERSREAVRQGQKLAHLYDAALELVHVVRDAGPYTGLAPSALSLRGLDDDRDRAVRRRLAQFVGAVAPAALHVALGAPSRQIAAVAAARGAGVVVVGTHGRGGAAPAPVGSTARATLQRAGCAVLTVGGAVGTRAAPVATPPALCSTAAA